jgi:hypothetical protein
MVEMSDSRGSAQWADAERQRCRLHSKRAMIVVSVPVNVDLREDIDISPLFV